MYLHDDYLTEVETCKMDIGDTWLFIILFLVLPSPTYLFTAGVEGFGNFIWSHSSTHHSR
jgi:hypothetical protein